MVPMPIYILKCTACERVEERVVLSFKEQVFTCSHCGGTCQKEPTSAKFSINGYNSNNGYSK